ncbi:hypothetical protein [Nocardia cerradoensis]|uniref:hypothetical protein n=1 Tax=Nocardia cerradoensis TaxID=85688 RepID=UPI0002EF7316|nr:hypothetical protein [Nocardia cerradoensis]NKY45423.1 hypothetical protein [Nocardia cerradoensis]
MTWQDQHARTDILHEVLARAAVDPAMPGLFYDLPECDRLFGGPTGVLAALRYRWDNHLHAKLDQAQLQGQSPSEAYQELAAEQPVLRAVLDAYEVRHWHREPALAR